MAGAVNVRLSGSRELLARLRQADRDYVRAFSAAIYSEGLALDAEMVPLIPKDTGRLRGSHFVTSPTSDGDRTPEVVVGVGTDYAVSVHENMQVKHRVGQAKFLEKPFKRRKSGYARRIKNATDNYYRSGIGMSGVVSGTPENPR